MTEILGVVYDVEEVDNTEPFVDAVYQSIVSPAPAVADKFTVPVEHLAALLPLGEDGNEFTVAITAVLELDEQLVVVFLACA